MHLLGHAEQDPRRVARHLEKRYFEVGNLGFPVIRAAMGGLDEINMGMMFCNDRRWPEACRVLGLQSVERVALGYNTPSQDMEAGGFEAHDLRVFHAHPSIQAGCYQNACFAVATAKAGIKDGAELFGRSIINPRGKSSPWRQAGTMSQLPRAAIWIWACWAGQRSSRSPSTDGHRPASGLPNRQARSHHQSGRTPRSLMPY